MYIHVLAKVNYKSINNEATKSTKEKANLNESCVQVCIAMAEHRKKDSNLGRSIANSHTHKNAQYINPLLTKEP